MRSMEATRGVWVELRGDPEEIAEVISQLERVGTYTTVNSQALGRMGTWTGFVDETDWLRFEADFARLKKDLVEE